MIKNYSLYETGKLTDRFDLADGLPKGVKPRYNITPATEAPVVVADGGVPTLLFMRWGLSTDGAKDTNSIFRYKTFNVKSEKVFAKTSWDSAIRLNRCIIPVNGFYCARRDDPDAVYYFTLPNKALMGLAGFYVTTTDHDGSERVSFTMLTIAANEAMPLPFERMPVILHLSDEQQWISKAGDGFSDIVRSMRPYEDGTLDYIKVSAAVHSKRDAADLTTPA